MKKITQLDTRGFLLMETLLVSLTIASVLLYMYVQYSRILDSYHRLDHYDTVESLYRTEVVKRYLLENAKASFFTDINGKVIEITSSGNSTLTDVNGWTTLWNDLKLSKLYIVAKNADISSVDGSFKNFLNSHSSSESTGKYEVVAKYNDGTFAAVAFDKFSGSGV